MADTTNKDEKVREQTDRMIREAVMPPANSEAEKDAALLARVVCLDHGKPSYRTCSDGHCMLVVR